MPAPVTSPRPALLILSDCRPGMVLAFTLIILTLMSLMGVTILLSSRTELSISGNASLSRSALASADTAARIATLIGLVLLKGGSLDDLVLAPASSLAYPLKVETSLVESDLEWDETGDFTQRYLRAGGVGVADVVLKTKNDQIVATAAISLVTTDPPADGGGSLPPQVVVPGSGSSLGGGDQYDYGGGEGGGGLPVVLMVSVSGRAIPMNSESADKRGDFFGGQDDEPRSIITILYREII